MDVARLPRPTSWTMLLEEIDYVKKTVGLCKTLVIDTIDWAEQLCVEYICAKHISQGSKTLDMETDMYTPKRSLDDS